MKNYAVVIDGDTDHFAWVDGLFGAVILARAALRDGASRVDICEPDQATVTKLRAVKTLVA